MESHDIDALTPEQRREFMLDARRRQGGICFICDEPIDLDAEGERGPELEHIQPLDAGGANTSENLAVVHAGCAESRPISDLRLARALAGLDRVRDEFGVGAAAAASRVPGGAVPADQEPPSAEDSQDSDAAGVDDGGDPHAEADRVEGSATGEPDQSGPQEWSPSDRRSGPGEPAAAEVGATTPNEGDGPAPDDRTYGGALGLTVVGAVVPGTAYLAAGRRRLGLVTLGVLLILLLIPVVVLALDQDLASVAADLVSRPNLLEILGFAVLVVAAAWIVVIATGHRMLLPKSASGPQQVVGGVLVVVLAAGVLVPSIVAARYAFATQNLIESVFGEASGGTGGAPSEIDRSDPWKDIPRLNLLVLGGDSTPEGGLTTNTMIIVSVDTTTGEAVLLGLPRNLQGAPIPADNPLNAIYPAGYRCGDGPRSCLLSGLYTEAEVTHRNLFEDDSDPGLSTLRGSVSEITGLEITYHLVVDLAGFEQIIDALGGIEVNVGPDRVPVVDLDAQGNPLPPDASTRYIPPGLQQLDGEEALAFARERSTDTIDNDDRLRRQVVTISAIVERADPVNLLLSYLEIASTASDRISTDVPVELLPALVDLSRSARTREIPSVPIPAVVDAGDPDFASIRRFVEEALS